MEMKQITMSKVYLLFQYINGAPGMIRGVFIDLEYAGSRELEVETLAYKEVYYTLTFGRSLPCVAPLQFLSLR